MVPGTDNEAFYQQVMSAVGAVSDDPYVGSLKVLVTLARFTGYCLSKCPLEKREFARSVVIQHLDASLREAPQPTT